MITAIRSARVKQGFKFKTAAEWAVKVAMYINEHYGTDSQVHTEVGGDLNRVHWITTYDSLAHAEEVGLKLRDDAGYQALIEESFNAQIFTNDSLADRIYMSVL